MLQESVTTGHPSRKPSTQRSAAQWRALIERQRASGLSVGAWCREHQITRSCFDRWRLKLDHAAQAASPFSSGATGTRLPLAPQPLSQQAFVDIGTLAADTEPAASTVELRLELGGGVVLTVRKG